MNKNDFIYNDIKYSSREQWQNEILPQLREEFPERPLMDMPKISAIVVHIRVNSNHTKDKAYVQAVEKDLTLLSGQKAHFVKAKKSVSNFKSREGQISGAKVTLRREKMKSFLAVLKDIVIPSIRDFRGLPKNFDACGGYNLTVFSHDVFPGIDVNEMKNAFKVYVNFVMKNVKNPKDGFVLLNAYKMPFIKKRGV